MLLAPVPWAARAWALPFPAALAPSERCAQKHRRHHKPVLTWARQMIRQAQQWLPDREPVVVADSAFAALDWLHALSRRDVTVVTCLRLDAALYTSAPPRKKGARLPMLNQVPKDQATRWRKLTMPGWHGQGDRTIRVCTGACV